KGSRLVPGERGVGHREVDRALRVDGSAGAEDLVPREDGVGDVHVRDATEVADPETAPVAEVTLLRPVPRDDGVEERDGHGAGGGRFGEDRAPQDTPVLLDPGPGDAQGQGAGVATGEADRSADQVDVPGERAIGEREIETARVAGEREDATVSRDG